MLTATRNKYDQEEKKPGRSGDFASPVLPAQSQTHSQLEQARAEDELARTVYQLREQAGLTQARLAKLIGTSESVISRLEDWDYKGHSLAMLKRIAAAVDKRIEIRFVPRDEKLLPA